MGPALCSPERPPSADWDQEAGQEAGQEADRSVLCVLVVTQTDEATSAGPIKSLCVHNNKAASISPGRRDRVSHT